MPTSRPQQLFLGFTAAYDKASNRIYARHLHNQRVSHVFPPDQHDSANRLRQYKRGWLTEPAHPDEAPGLDANLPFRRRNMDRQRDYGLDLVGNWDQTSYTKTDGTNETDNRDHDKNNQVTSWIEGGVADDANGNITSDGTLTFAYDAFNRLRQVKRDGTLIAEYFYDAFGRRIRKVTVDPHKKPAEQTPVTASNISTTVTRRYDSTGRMVEDYQDIDGTAYPVTNTKFQSLTPIQRQWPSVGTTGRKVDFTIDTIYRRTEAADAGAAANEFIARRHYYGSGRTAELELGNGIICTHLNDAQSQSAVQGPSQTNDWGDHTTDRLGYDGALREIAKRYLNIVHL